MHDTFHDYYAPVKTKLDEAFKSSLAPLLESAGMKDIETLTSLLGAGKKIRGCMLCLVSLSLGATLEEALPMALAVELVQTASLIHDDFVDQDITRRNRPAIWTLEGSRRAVLLGDVLFSTAIKNMSDIGNEACRAISEAILKIASGALREPIIPETLRGDIVSGRYHPEMYETIIRLKSGTLFSTSCKLGAIAAGADKNTQEVFQLFGAQVGEAYQIADDLHDILQHIEEPSDQPDRLMLLAPILLFFAEEIKPLVLAAMKEESATPSADSLPALKRVARLMREEIEKRLQGARSALGGLAISPPYKEVLENAPRELIVLFDASKFNNG